MKDSFVYKLSTPIEVSKSGKQIEGKKVLIKCPRPSDKHIQIALETILGPAMNKSLKSDVETDNEVSKKSSKEITEDEKYILWEHLLFTNLEEKRIQSLLNNFSEIICEGNLEDPQGTIEGVKFTKPLFDLISGQDFKALVARYAVDFLFFNILKEK